MKLAIISHTEHYRKKDGTIIGWGPTVREINHLIDIFDEVYHIAMLSDEPPPKSALEYSDDRIHFVKIAQVGGKDFKSKVSIFLNAPRTIKTVSKILKKVECFQFRAPTGIGVYLIPYLSLFSRKKGWFKYAGNWNQRNPPLGYALQKQMLQNQKRPVTINGHWQDQPGHCITFENPCLSRDNLIEGLAISENKNFNGKLNFCFVGRLEDEKGVKTILEAFQLLSLANQDKIGNIFFVGSGNSMEDYMLLSRKLRVQTKFLGALSSTQVFDIYKKSHFLLLPSTASEGFPKVIAEAINFGCIPIVSNVSSISQYIIEGKNGFVLTENTKKNLHGILVEILGLDRSSFIKYISFRKELVEKFTFDYYNSRIKNEII